MSDSLDINEVKIELIATVMSIRGGVLLRELENDYNKLTGKCLPYQKFGFNSLIEFIQNLGTFKIVDTGCEIIIYALSNEKTKHMDSFINKYEKPTEPNSKKNPAESSYYKSDFSGNSVNNRGYSTSKKKNVKNSEVSNNDISSEKADIQKSNALEMLTSMQQIKPFEFDEISSNLKSIISSTDGILLQNIESEYINMTGGPLPHQKFGCKTLLDFIRFQGIYKVENRQSMIYVEIKNTSNTRKAKRSRRKKIELDSLCDHKNNASDNNVSAGNNSRLKQNLDLQVQPANVESDNISEVLAQDRLHTFSKKCSSDSEPTNAPVLSPTDYTENLNFKIKQLQFEQIYNKEITVKSVTSSSKLWVVLDDLKNDKNFLEMERKLNNTQQFDDQCRPDHLIIDHPYALYDSGKWRRIVVKCINLDDTVKCLFIDIGLLVDNVNKKKIYLLHPSFYNICGQAVEIILSNVKSIGGFPMINDILIEELLFKTCMLKPVDKEKDPLTVKLYDIDSMDNLNDIVLNTFFKKISPILNSLESDPFSAIKAKVLSIEDGYLYLRLNNNIMNSLENLLTAPDLFTGPYLKNIKNIDLKKVYLTSYNLNLKGRVKVTNIYRNAQVKVFFIDYGKSNIVKVEELIDLHNIDITIAQLPSQAVKVILNMFPPESLTSNTVEIFFELLENKLDVSIIVLHNLAENIPCIQLMSDLYPCSLINVIMLQRLKE